MIHKLDRRRVLLTTLSNYRGEIFRVRCPGAFFWGGQMSVYRDCMLTVCLDSRRRRDAQAEGERGRDVNEASWAFFPLYSALVRSM